jgi:hypothetical protein
MNFVLILLEKIFVTCTMKTDSIRIISWLDGYTRSNKPDSEGNYYYYDYWEAEGWSSAAEKLKYWLFMDGKVWTSDTDRCRKFTDPKDLKKPGNPTS